MKKILVVILSFFLFNINISAINASSYIALDLDSGLVLEGSNINDKRLIASITKILTCIITIENIDINKEVVVGKEVLEAYGSAIYIEMNEKISIKNLLYGLMLRSGNDAAIILAKNVSGSMPNFVKLMNNKVSELGLKNTTFSNNHGLEDKNGENKSTAYDMAMITRYAMKNKIFREIFGTKNIVVKSDKKTYSWKNKNRILHTYDYITGGKTGYTIKAKRTLVTTASKDNKNVVIVTLNDPNDFENHIKIYERIFKNYKLISVLDKDNFSIENDKLYAKETKYIKNSFNILARPDSSIRIDYALYKKRQGYLIGQAKIFLDSKMVHEEPIFIKKTNIIKKINIFNKIIDWIKSW